MWNCNETGARLDRDDIEGELADWGLCVGIGHYPEVSGLVALPGACEDARDFYEWLIDPAGGGVAPAHCKLVLSPAGQSQEGFAGKVEPVKGAIEDCFFALYNRGVQRAEARRGFRVGRRLYLFFAGHGVALGGHPHGGGQPALLTAEARISHFFPHFAARVWADHFRFSGAFDEVVLIMDCCSVQLSKVAVSKPPWVPDTGEEAQFLYAFAAQTGAVARELEIDGRPRGLFTHTLMSLLRDGSKPLSAKQLKERLEAHPALRKQAPRVEATNEWAKDFQLVGTPLPVLRDGPWLIYDPDDAAAEALRRLALLPSRPLADAEAGTSLEGKELILVLARESGDRVGALLDALQPARAVHYGELEGVADARLCCIARREGDTPAAVLLRLRAALDGRPLSGLRIEAEPFSYLHLSDESDRLLAEGWGSLQLDDLPDGTYVARASIGNNHGVPQRIEHQGVTNTLMSPVPIASAFPLQGAAGWTDEEREKLAAMPGDRSMLAVWRGLKQAPSFVLAGEPEVPLDPPGGVLASVPATGWGAERALLYYPVGTRQLALSLPRRPGMRTEVYLTQRAADAPPEVSVRVVSEALPPGAPQPSDRVREALRSWLEHGGGRGMSLPPEVTAGDPVAGLLALALAEGDGAADTPALARLRAEVTMTLGDEDPDLSLWHGKPVALPPLIAASWTRALAAGHARVREGSTADGVVDRAMWQGPWMAWDPSAGAGRRSWLREAAAAVWSGWSDGTDASLASQKSDVALRLGAPADSVMRVMHRIYKSPPVEPLRQHDTIAFVGASNDQLAPTLVLAFALRDKRPWSRLQVWFLCDEKLEQMRSDGRSAAALKRARDAAVRELETLLPQVAKNWKIVRYDGFFLDQQWHFASLYDWTAAGGYVHISPYNTRDDVRVTPYQDLHWQPGATGPSPAYQAAVEAFEALAFATELASSDAAAAAAGGDRAAAGARAAAAEGGAADAEGDGG